MEHPIALYLIGGFLGSGKTTFLRQLLPQLPQGRLGLLVNEFGSIGVDGAVLRDGTLKVVEINNGSIFCACLKDGFVRTLKAFSEQPIDHLFIEASGMADLAGMPALLARLSPYLARPYDYRGLICLVDCVTFPDCADVLLPVENQLRAADLILLNKTDLVSASDLTAVRKTVRDWNEDATIYETRYGAVPLALLDAELSPHGREGIPSNTPWTRPTVYTLTAPPLTVGEDGIRQFYQQVSPHILRLKGFLETAGGLLHVDGVCGQLELSPCLSTPLAGTLVAIGRSAVSFDNVLLSAWRSHCGPTLTITES